MQPINVMLVNETSTESTEDAWNTAWALDYQARFHFAPAWRISARVTLMPKDHPIPVGAWIIHMLDNIDDPSALGYHDEDGNEVPYSRVGVKASIADGSSASEVASHELLEMLVDPHINLTVIDQKNNRLYGYEVGDPVQGNAYDVGAPEGRVTGVAVADFALPAWFDGNTPVDAPSSFRASVKGPFAVAPKGYTGWLDLSNVAQGWQSSWGSERSSAPVDLDDRLNRRDAILLPGAGA